MLRHSDLLSRILEPLITLAYLLVFWYVSVNVVFSVKEISQHLVGGWLVLLLVDVVLNVNTVKLIEGRSLKSRRALLMEYLRKESYLDLVMVLYIVLDGISHGLELDITIHLVSLASLVVRLTRKGELLRTYFAFKKYTPMIDSIFILMSFGHLSVKKEIM